MPGPLPKYTIILTKDQEKELEHISYRFKAIRSHTGRYSVHKY